MGGLGETVDSTRRVAEVEVATADLAEVPRKGQYVLTSGLTSLTRIRR